MWAELWSQIQSKATSEAGESQTEFIKQEGNIINGTGPEHCPGKQREHYRGQWNTRELASVSFPGCCVKLAARGIGGGRKLTSVRRSQKCDLGHEMI